MEKKYLRHSVGQDHLFTNFFLLHFIMTEHGRNKTCFGQWCVKKYNAYVFQTEVLNAFIWLQLFSSNSVISMRKTCTEKNIPR